MTRRFLLGCLVVAFLVVLMTVGIGKVDAVPDGPTATLPTHDMHGCAVIVHHGMNDAYGEETAWSAWQATQWGFGPEIDARKLLDNALGTGHNDAAGQVTGGADRRRWSEMTTEEFRALNLTKGGHPGMLWELIAASLLNPHGKVMVTVNGWREFETFWTTEGLAKIRAMIGARKAWDRVYLGGFGGTRQFIADHWPAVHTFRRLEPGDPADVTPLVEQGVDLVALPRDLFQADFVTALKAEGMTVATRNYDPMQPNFQRRAYAAGIRVMQANAGASTIQTCREGQS